MRIIVLLIVLLYTSNCLAQNVDNSPLNMQVYFHIHDELDFYNRGKKGFAIGAGLSYSILDNLDIRLGMEINSRLSGVSKLVPNLNWPAFYYFGETKNYFIELPAGINFTVLPNKRISPVIGAYNVNSFLGLQILKEDLKDYKDIVQTTIYQSYLQLSLGLRYKVKDGKALFISPFYRHRLVDYYNDEIYDISYYPNVFYEKMLGIAAGVSMPIGGGKD